MTMDFMLNPFCTKFVAFLPSALDNFVGFFAHRGDFGTELFSQRARFNHFDQDTEDAEDVEDPEEYEEDEDDEDENENDEEDDDEENDV